MVLVLFGTFSGDTYQSLSRITSRACVLLLIKLELHLMLRRHKLSNLKIFSLMPKRVGREWSSVYPDVRACLSFSTWTTREVIKALEAVASEEEVEATPVVVTLAEAVDLHLVDEVVEDKEDHEVLGIKMHQSLLEILPTATESSRSKPCLAPKVFNQSLPEY